MSADYHHTAFVAPLLAWHQHIDRQLPWKNQSAYEVWLSEILLQQTRLEQGRPYYLRFLAAFPDVAALANAHIDEVLRHWQGLGYYARARNLHKAAQIIVNQHSGKFPDTYEGIRALVGVGDYTAAAIASFVFGLPHAVVDGNVYRVLSRFFDIHTPIDSTEGKKAFATLAQSLLPAAQAAIYNQAIMDFGALVCTPKAPDCKNCPLRADCLAFQRQTVAALPKKSKKITKKDRFFSYLVLEFDGGLYLRRRGAGDIWEGLHDFPCIEAENHLKINEIKASEIWPANAVFEQIIGPLRQQLTHQNVHAQFISGRLDAPLADSGYIWVPRAKISDFAAPKIILDYLNQPPQLGLFGATGD